VEIANGKPGYKDAAYFCEGSSQGGSTLTHAALALIKNRNPNLARTHAISSHLPTFPEKELRKSGLF